LGIDVVCPEFHMLLNERARISNSSGCLFLCTLNILLSSLVIPCGYGSICTNPDFLLGSIIMRVIGGISLCVFISKVSLAWNLFNSDIVADILPSVLLDTTCSFMRRHKLHVVRVYKQNLHPESLFLEKVFQSGHGMLQFL
jgi:hypothetical protein